MIELSIDMRAYQRFVDKMSRSARREFVVGAQRAVQFVAFKVRQEAEREFTGGYGLLATSFKVEARGVSQGEVKITLYSELPYARIQNDGGIVRPKTGKALAIPLNATARQKWPRHWPKGRLVLLKRKRILAEKLGKGKRVKPMYKLVPQSIIPATHYFDKGVAKGTVTAVNLMNEALDRAIEGAE